MCVCKESLSALRAGAAIRMWQHRSVLASLAKNLGLKPCRASPCDSSRASALAGRLRRGLVPSAGGSSPALQRGRGSPRGKRSWHALSASCQADTPSAGACAESSKRCLISQTLAPARAQGRASAAGVEAARGAAASPGLAGSLALGGSLA